MGSVQNDRDRWNLRWAERSEPTGPSSWLQSLEIVPRSGTALDVAGGPGGNALWLAARGLSVTLVDLSDVAVDLSREAAQRMGLSINTEVRDLTASGLPQGPWDLIVIFHYLQRDLFPTIPSFLSPGGLLVVSLATIRNLERRPRPPLPYLLALGELPTLVPGLEILTSEEGWFSDDRHEARIVARRPISDP